MDSELPKGKSCVKRNRQYANCLRANSALCATDNAIREYEEDEEVDSCWGFYNDSWGDKLFEEVARDFGISEELFDNIEEVA